MNWIGTVIRLCSTYNLAKERKKQENKYISTKIVINGTKQNIRYPDEENQGRDAFR